MYNVRNFTGCVAIYNEDFKKKEFEKLYQKEIDKAMKQ